MSSQGGPPSERKHASVCAACGQFDVYGERGGKAAHVTFDLPSWELVEAAAQYARLLSGEAGRSVKAEEVERLAAENAALRAERDRLLGLLAACELAMDTAAQHGLPQQLPPAYRESWAAAHTAARAALAPKP
jgi:hypothetical protein